ncbi:MAG TPA: phage tail sheath C-terminal domain-containing protein [Rudaea sp.]|nr:phage tail sheath C-terminal domain-containing protein [Rudaea sp.]
MPVALTYPGVYVEEIKSGVHTIIGVATSVTAFIGRAPRGPVNQATVINSFADYERQFGGLSLSSSMSYAVRDFYLNGGQQAVIVRLFNPAFANAADQDAAEAGVKAIADSAVAAASGKDAKKAANDAYTKLIADPNSTAPQKAGAKFALGVISLVADAGTQDDVKAAVAVAQTPFTAQIPIQLSTLQPDGTSKAAGNLNFVASSPGAWGSSLRIAVDQKNARDDVAQGLIGPSGAKSDLFNVYVTDTASSQSETFLNLTVKDSARRVDLVLQSQSALLRYDGKPDGTVALGQGIDAVSAKQADVTKAQAKLLADQMNGATQATLDADNAAISKAKNDAATATDLAASDGGELTASDFLPDQGEANKQGLYALEQLYSRDQLFNLLCIPPYNPVSSVGAVDIDVDPFLLDYAASYCEKRRAMLIVDPRSGWSTTAQAIDGYNNDIGTRSSNAALFFPRVLTANPLHDNQIESFAPCGIVAGVFARTDTQRGVWKAPAGIDASLVGVASLHVPLTDDEHGELNPLGINCLRNFPVYGRVLWGSRTLKGADAFADEYKYVPVRRTALYIEESLYRGTQWVVFEPNDAPLWAQIRLNVGAFMHNLFRQGAFQGSTPKDAYFVKCDGDTTTQNDIDAGIVNIVVGFAPLKPAEFVVIQLQQMAGQIQT